MANVANNLSKIIHPAYKGDEWGKFRLTYKGGKDFIRAYLQKFSRFEDDTDFEERLALTYNPAHASSVVRLVKNAIFQRLVDVKREAGSVAYQAAVSGQNGGVDLKNRSMNSFLGDIFLPELLPIGKVGVWVDMPKIPEGASQKDSEPLRPYLYIYQAEDIETWEEDNSAAPGRFKALKLCDHVVTYDDKWGLPNGTEKQYRIVKKTEEGVEIRFFDKDENELPNKAQTLQLSQIPFVLGDLEQSLLQDIADYQISMLNMASSDVNFLQRANFPIYTEQFDPKFRNNQRRATDFQTGTQEQARTGAAFNDTLEARITRQLEGEAVASQQGDAAAGAGKGRMYPTGADRPGFINPSSEPVEASMKKQAIMAEEIRLLADLALSSLAAKYASGESKKLDKEGLEAGLSYIGLVCERVENEIAQIWAEYEATQTAVIKYPTNYSIRTEEDRRTEAKEYKDLIGAVTSRTFSKLTQKRIAMTLYGQRIDANDMNTMIKEIEDARGLTADPEVIKSDVEIGLVSNQTASVLRGYPEDEAEKAKKDHAERAAAIAKAQSDASARGVKDMGAGNPADEKKASKDNALNTSVKDKVRGDAN